jgi:DNA-binding winged helix-turn-helix (wHTH) protein/thioredoxin-like negative regulator of GroEL
MKEGGKPFETIRYQVGDLVINLSDRTVYRENEHLPLPELSFDLFAKLVQKAPNPVDRDTLVSDVWHSKFVNDDTIVQRVAMLRKALDDDPKTPKYIRTVRGAGYAILAPVIAKETNAPSNINTEEKEHTGKYTQFKKIQYLAVAALIIYTTVVMTWPDRSLTETQPQSPGFIQSGDDKLTEQARQLLSVWQAGETNKAIDLLRSLLARNPSHTQATLTLSFALSTRETKFNGIAEDAIEAEELARKILEKHTHSGRAWHALAYALDAQSRIDEALLAYQKAFEINPNDITAMSSAAHLMFVRGRLYEALKLDLKGQQSPDSSIFSELQIAKNLELLELPHSNYWWKEAEKLPLNDEKFRRERIQHFLTKNQLLEAEQLVAETLSIYPESQSVYYLKARLMLHKSDAETARKYYLLAGQQGTGDLAALTALQGDITEAQKQIESIQLEILKGNTWPAIRLELAELYAATGKEKESIKALTDAIDLGWRDIKAVETSPFLKSVSTSASWTVLKTRVQQELSAQRALVINIDEL